MPHNRCFVPRLLGILPALLLTALAPAQPQRLWLEQFGTTDGDNAEGAIPDGSGGVFICGDTYGSLGGPNAGGQDAWVARYDSTGQRVWIAQLGTVQADHAYALAQDGSGGVFVGGPTWGDLGAPNQGMHDAFIARFDADGKQLWAAQFGTARDDQFDAFLPDGAGGVYAVGIMDGDTEDVPEDPSAGDAFLARYDSGGKQLWLKRWGTNQEDEAFSVVSDGAGGLFIGGDTGGDLYGPNAGTQGTWDAFLAHFSADGHEDWGIQFGTDDFEAAIGMTHANDGGVFIVGVTFGDLGGPGAGEEDVFITRRAPGGEEVWTIQFGTEESDIALPIVLDEADGVYTAGYTRGDLEGPNSGGTDAFLAHHDGDGTVHSIVQFGTKTDDEALAMAPDSASGVIFCGGTHGNLGDTHFGDQDAFIARYGPDCYADCDDSGGLDLFDFLCYIGSFNLGFDSADCDANGILDLFDFLCFVNAFNDGC